jgi:uncharacterized membrane protein YdbT with pleckstrin-like domain
MDPDHVPTQPLPTGKIESINETETKLVDIRRHPFGLIVMYIETIVGLGGALLLLIYLVPGVISQSPEQKANIVGALAAFSFFAIVLAVIFLLIATYIYRQNRLIVTNLNVTQVIQASLFNRKVSEIAMSNVEDVTSHKQGLFPTLFNFGTLRIETAGEQNNFIFVYCPKPDAIAKAVLDAREQFLYRRNQQRTPVPQNPEPSPSPSEPLE